MTSMTVRKAKYAKCIICMHQSNRPNPKLSKAVMFSCSCRRFGNTRLHLQPLKSRHLQVFKRNKKNDKAVPRLHLKQTSWVPAVDPLQASRGVCIYIKYQIIKLYHPYSPDWNGPAKLWYAKAEAPHDVTIWNISKMDPIKEFFYFDLPARQQEPSWEVLILLGRTWCGHLALHSVTGSRSELLKSKWICCHEKHALVGSYSQLIAQYAVLNVCLFHGEGNSM